MSLEPIASTGMGGSTASPSTGGLSSLDMQAINIRVDAARSQDEAQQVTQAAAKASQGGPATDKQLAKLHAVSQDFESIFLGYMMKTMRESVAKGGLWGDSQGEQIFTEMRDDEMAKGLSKAGGIGLAKLLEEQLKQSLLSHAQAQKQAEKS